MRATILPYAIILTKAHWAAFSVMAKRCIRMKYAYLHGYLLPTVCEKGCVLWFGSIPVAIHPLVTISYYDIGLNAPSILYIYIYIRAYKTYIRTYIHTQIHTHTRTHTHTYI